MNEHGDDETEETNEQDNDTDNEGDPADPETRAKINQCKRWVPVCNQIKRENREMWVWPKKVKIPTAQELERRRENNQKNQARKCDDLVQQHPDYFLVAIPRNNMPVPIARGTGTVPIPTRMTLRNTPARRARGNWG